MSDTGPIKNWGMTPAIRETGWKGGEAVEEAPLRAFGEVAPAPGPQAREIPADPGANPPSGTAIAPASGSVVTPTAPLITPQPAPAKIATDALDKLASLRINAVLDAAKAAPSDIGVADAAAAGLATPTPPPAPPPPPKKKKRKKKRGFFKKLGRKLKATVKKAGRAIKGIAKGAIKAVKGAVKATIAAYKTVAKTALNLAKTGLSVAGKLLQGDLKGAGAAAKDGLKETWNDVKAGAKEVWKNTKEGLKGLGEVITNTMTLLETTVPGLKLVTDFMKTPLGQKILMAMGILAMIPPLTAVLGPVMLAVALYQGAGMLGQGLENGDFKTAAMGALTVVSSAIGLGAATGGAAATAGTQKILNISSNALKAGVAIDRGDWKGAVLAGASVGASVSGSAVATQVANTATKGIAAAEAIKNKDWLAAGAAVAAVGAAGLALAAADVDDSKPKPFLARKWDEFKQWAGDKWDGFKETPVGKAVVSGADWVKDKVDAADQYLFGSYDADGVRQPDGLVQKVGAWWNENVQQPVANAFAPVKNALGGVGEGLDETAAAIKQPLEDGAAALDKGAYGADGRSGAFGTVKDGVSKLTDPLADAADKGSAIVRDGAANLANKASGAIGTEPAAAGTAPGATGPLAMPAGTAALQPPAEPPGALEKAWNWLTGKADAAQTNADNIMGKVDAVRQDAAAVQNDVAAKLEEINRAHDTFMAGVNTVRAVKDGDGTRALREGGTFMAGVGYTDMGAGMQNVAHKTDQAKQLARDLEDGNVAGALQDAGDLAGLQDISATGRKLTEAQRLRDAVNRGDVADAVLRAGQLADSRETEDLGRRLMDLDEAKRAMERGDTAAALTGLGSATGSKALSATGDTLRDVQGAADAAKRGDAGQAVSRLGRAAGNRRLQKLGDKVDAGQTAARALDGHDRYGNPLDPTDRASVFLTATGRATDSDELQQAGLAVNQAAAVDEALDAGNEVGAHQAASGLARTLGRRQASANLAGSADDLANRQRTADGIGGALEDGRLGDAVDGIAATQGMKAEQVAISQDTRDFETNAQKAGELLTAAEKLGKSIT